MEAILKAKLLRIIAKAPAKPGAEAVAKAAILAKLRSA